MSRVIAIGDWTKVQGPWQIKCRNCDSLVELTIDCLKSCSNGEWWDCPACGTNISVRTVLNK